MTTHPDLKLLKCSLTQDEFSAVKWAANRAGPSGAVPLAEFYRLALWRSLREVLAEQVRRGKNPPANLCDMIREPWPSLDYSAAKEVLHPRF
jgi:hypothetical protein